MTDKAQLGGFEKNGGIDLNRVDESLQVQDQRGEIKFNMDPAMLQQLQNAVGFVPVIIDIEPVGDLTRFLNSPVTTSL